MPKINTEGRCACGCGQRTKLSDRTDPKRAVVRGQPLWFISGHGRRGRYKQRFDVRDCGYSTPCWVWLLALNKVTGYGYETLSGKKELAHRYVYIEHRGPIPDDLQLDHLCRNRACVNPEHLDPVTNAENARRGRRAKLTWPTVQAIRGSSDSTIALGSRYGVHPAHVSRIKANKRWVA